MQNFMKRFSRSLGSRREQALRNAVNAQYEATWCLKQFGWPACAKTPWSCEWPQCHKHAQSKRTYNEGTEQDTSNCKQNVLKLVLKKIMIHVFESYTFFESFSRRLDFSFLLCVHWSVLYLQQRLVVFGNLLRIKVHNIHTGNIYWRL